MAVPDQNSFQSPYVLGCVKPKGASRKVLHSARATGLQGELAGYSDGSRSVT